ncbi:MAG: DUF169 domain-containing protein [Candidatus Methanomethylophilaceae archaeon]|nr:DUF169 domain-containing protein [Candidatus Methanomethylophilaceae archaeon]
MNLADQSLVLQESLGLRHYPVAVSFLKADESVPSEYEKPSEPLRHCQAVMRARKGEMLVLPSDMHACKVGSSVLGMNVIPEKAENGELHSSMGLFSSPEAAHDAIAVRPMMMPNSVVGTVYSPLSSASIEPDVVLITATPEQAQWLLPSAHGYNDGSRISLNMSTVLAACGDATVLPYITGKPNASFGCFGLRKSTDISADEMIVGIPIGKLDSLINSISSLSKSTIPKSRSK